MRRMTALKCFTAFVESLSPLERKVLSQTIGDEFVAFVWVENGKWKEGTDFCVWQK